jgi:putative nucleotidyltransferase-like protein
MKLDLPASLWPLVHRAAGGEGWPPSSEAAADLLVAQATRQGLLPLLFEAYDEMPPPVQASLARHRGWQRVHSRRLALLRETIPRVCAILRDEPLVLLKGADYMHRLYPRPDLRPMDDIDVLVPRARIDAVCRLLEEAGLRPRHPAGRVSTLPSYHERVFDADGVIVEVHHSFIQRPRHRIDYEAVWSRRLPVEADGWRAARLADADALAYHALASSVDAFAVPLVRYVDLWLMLKTAPHALEPAAARAREWQAVHAFYGAFRQAFRFFPEIRTAERAAVIEGLLPAPARSFVDRFVLPRPREHGRERVGRGLRLWRKFWLMDNLRRRAGLALYHVYATAAGRRT